MKKNSSTSSDSALEMRQDREIHQRSSRKGVRHSVSKRNRNDSNLDESDDESALFLTDNSVDTATRPEIAVNNSQAEGLSVGSRSDVEAKEGAEQHNANSRGFETAEMIGPFQEGSPQSETTLEQALENLEQINKLYVKLMKANRELSESKDELQKRLDDSMKASVMQADRAKQELVEERQKANEEKDELAIKLKELDQALADAQEKIAKTRSEKKKATSMEIKLRNALRKGREDIETARQEHHTTCSNMEMEIILAGGKPNAQCLVKEGCIPLITGVQLCLNCQKMENEGSI